MVPYLAIAGTDPFVRKNQLPHTPEGLQQNEPHHVTPAQSLPST
jgi:hypothetical protein